MTTAAAAAVHRRPDHLRVLTLNLWAQHGDWRSRRSVLRDGLRALQPDLIGFQEAITTDDYDQVVDLIGTDYYVAHQTEGLVGDGQHHGASIASRWPLQDVREIDLHATPRPLDYSCTTLTAEIHAPEPFGPLLLANSGPWYPWWAEYEREVQAVASAQFVEDFVGGRDLHVVLTGEFNAVPDAASVRYWKGRQSLGSTSVCYGDVWERIYRDDPGHTYSPTNPLVVQLHPHVDTGRRIDYIFIRCQDHGPTLEVAACTLAFDEPVDGVWASDHFAVVADLTVPRRTEGGMRLAHADGPAITAGPSACPELYRS